MSDAKISIGADASAAEKAARAALNAWKSVASGLAEGFTAATRSVVSDLGQIAVAQGHVSFASQHQQVREFEAATARLATASGRDLESIRSQVEATGQAIGKRPAEIANWIQAVGRLTYSYDAAGQSIKGMSALAAETGRSVEDYTTLAAVLENVGKVSGDSTRMIGVLTAQADHLGVAGGVAAFADQIESLGDVVSNFRIDSEQDFSKVTALAAEMGRGLSAQQAQRVQQSAFGSLASNPMEWSRYLGRDITDEFGHVVNPTAVMKEITDKIKRTYGKDARRMLMYQFGAETGAALYRADFDQAAQLAGVQPSERPSESQQKLNATDAQKRAIAEANLAQSSRAFMGSQSTLGGAADTMQQFAGNHPIWSTIASSMAGSALTSVVSKVLRVPAGIMGKGGEALDTILGLPGAGGAGGAGLGAALGEGTPVFVTNWPGDLGGGLGGAGGLLGGGGAGIAEGALLTGGGIMAPLAGIVATALAQLGLVASIGVNRDEMGKNWREEHKDIIAAEQKVKAEKAAPTMMQQLTDKEREKELAFSRELQKAGLSPDEALAQVKAASEAGTVPDITIEVNNTSDTPITATVKNSKSAKAGSQAG